MALLCSRVDVNTIRLVGRWKSDAVFRYLHAQALPIIDQLSSKMVQHGSYTLLPGHSLPQQAVDAIRDEQQALLELYPDGIRDAEYQTILALEAAP